MRIGFITGEYPPMRGGVGDYTRALGGALAVIGHSVFVLTDRRGVGDGAPGIAVTPIVDRWNIQSLRTIRRWAVANRLDVINVQFETAAYASLLPIHFWPRAVAGLPIRTVTTYHDLIAPYLFRYAGRLRNAALWTMGRASDGVIATNAGDAARLTQALRQTPIADIPIGSNIPTAPPIGYTREGWRDDAHLAPDTFLVGYFGFLNPQKGIELLIDAFATLVDRTVDAGLDAHLVMIGGGATESDPGQRAYTDTLRARIAAAGLTDRVRWTGFLDAAQVSSWLLACDLMALPFSDGVSLRRGSFMAALAHGCPILTNTPRDSIDGLTIAETGVADQSDTVALVPAGDQAAFTEALITLAHDLTRRSALGRQARRFADRFRWDTIAAQMIDFYQRVGPHHRQGQIDE